MPSSGFTIVLSATLLRYFLYCINRSHWFKLSIDFRFICSNLTYWMVVVLLLVYYYIYCCSNWLWLLVEYSLAIYIYCCKLLFNYILLQFTFMLHKSVERKERRTKSWHKREHDTEQLHISQAQVSSIIQLLCLSGS